MPHTTWPAIFISYARQSALRDARALKDHLGADAFLDESDIETRADFAHRIVEALLAARLIVVFSDDVYHARPVCRWELGLILAP